MRAYVLAGDAVGMQHFVAERWARRSRKHASCCMRDSPNEKPLLDCPQKHPASRTMIQSIVATATLNRPGRLNACTAPLGEALRAAG